MGSCFSQNIGQRLEDLKYNICNNPFGVLYNPMSIRNSLALLFNNYVFQADDLSLHQGLWHSFQHHSSFSHPDKDTCLATINSKLEEARNMVKDADLFIFTFGTAWVYELANTGQVVSNCHKVPAENFNRRRLALSEIVDRMKELFDYLKSIKPNLNIILTLSPIRHLKDGFVDNNISKSTLLLAIHELVEKLDYIHYFPAYEILIDDLRDYRFYDRDLLHPNEIAVDYVWDHFVASYLSERENSLRKTIQKIKAAKSHRAFNPTSAEHQKFIKKQLKQIEQLKKSTPHINLKDEETHFKAQLFDR